MSNESLKRIEPTFTEEENLPKVVFDDEPEFNPAVFKSNRGSEVEPDPAVWGSRRTVESQDTDALQSEKPETAQIYKFPSKEAENLESINDEEVDFGLEETIKMLENKRDELRDEIGLRSIQLSRLSPDNVDVPRITEEKETFHRELDELEKKLIQKNQTEILETDDYIQAVDKLQGNIVILEENLAALEESDLSEEEKEHERISFEADLAKDKETLYEYTTEATKEQIDILGIGEASEAMAGSLSTGEGVETKSELVSSGSEKEQQKAEYLSLKHDFKNSQREYNKALEEDYAARGVLSKLLGLGRGSMSPQVETAHTAFVKANAEYHKFAQSSGTYQRIAERLNRQQNNEEQVSVNPLVFDRHVLRPAEQRLELQTLHLPENVQKLKASLIEKIKANPKTAIAFGGLAIGAVAAINLPGLVMGMAARNATKFVGDKFTGSKERELMETKEGMIDSIDGDTSLEKMEEEYYKGLKGIRNAENYTRTVSGLAGGLAAGGVGGSYAGLFGSEDISIGDASKAQELFAEAGDINFESIATPDNVSELMHMVERGDTTSEIINNTVRERLAAGELVLPNGVSENGISHWMYQSFPELTNATGVQPRLTPAEWIDLGVSSGNPQDIKPGEMINVETLLEKMRGMDTFETQLSPDVSPNISEKAVEAAVDVPAQEAPVLAADVPLDGNDIKFPSEGYDVQTHYESDPSGVVYEVHEESLPTNSGAEKVIEMKPYSPYISEKLAQQSYQFTNPEPGSLHKHLAETMIREFRASSINLPNDAAIKVFQNETAMYGFIEKNIPDLSTNWLSKTLRGGPDLFSSQDWINYGIKSGDPTNIAPGETVKTGEIIKKILEISGNKTIKV